MKIQRQVSKKVGDKTYYKYVIVIPEELIKKSGLKEKDDLTGDAEKGKLIIRESKKDS